MINQEIFSFLQRRYDPARPLLLGLSGGPDSLALWSLLLKFRSKHPLTFGVAHLDHGWREESATEAAQLQEMVESKEVPFHFKRLDPKMVTGNLEAACRLERLCFFRELCQIHGYQAVLLGHHADDQAETVLKRIFEGARLLKLSGLQEESVVDGVNLWRPLLPFSKREILKYVEKKRLNPFYDKTNEDPRFLRGKLRTELLPTLVKAFGKEISQNLCQLGEDALELRNYVERKFHHHLMNIKQGSMGLHLDVAQYAFGDPFETKILVQMFCEKASLPMSREAIETTCALILSNAADKQVSAGKKKLHIDRGHLFAPDEDS